MLYAVIIYIRKLTSLIGNIVAIFRVVTFGPLHYRYLQRNKKEDLVYYNNKYEKMMIISGKAKHEIL